MIKCCKGFSLVEVVLLMVILSILSASAFSRLNFAGHDADGYAEVIKSSLRLAQKLAIAKRTTPVTVTFPVNPCNGSPVDGVQVDGEQCDPLPNGVQVSGFSSVTFNGLGRPSVVAANVAVTPGNVAFVTAITVAGGDVSRVICLEPETGYVHAEEAC